MDISCQMDEVSCEESFFSSNMISIAGENLIGLVKDMGGVIVVGI